MNLFKHFAIGLFTILAFTQNAMAAQEDWDSISKVATMNLFYNPGYITALGGVGNIEPLLFEADIIPYYTIEYNKILRWNVILSPQVLFRMYDQESAPIRTPSYMPRIIVTHQFVNHDRQRDWFAYASWYHHSNGQDGSFYCDDSTTINTHDGSFSTNWIEGGVFLSRFKNAGFERQYYFKLGGKYCYLQDGNLDGLYGKTRFFANLKSQWNLSKALRFINEKYFDQKDIFLTFDLDLEMIADKFKNESYFESNRFTLKYTLSFKPSFWRDIRIFGQYYYGPDYYNIYFYRNLHVLRFGIIAKTTFFD